MKWLQLILPLLAFASGLRAVERSSPATNWVLPIFTDKEGHRSLTARGSEVRPLDKNSIAVTDLSITIFSGDAASRVETIFLSPLATLLPTENRALGDKSVRIVRNDLEATGRRWVYDHAQKHVTLDGNVRIVFNAEIKDLLK